MRRIPAPLPAATSRIKEKHDGDKNPTLAKNHRERDTSFVVSYELQTDRSGATVDTYVTKASSLAKTLIKPLTIIPTKPDLKPIHRLCTKQSGGMQVPSHTLFSVMNDVCCTWRLNEKWFISNNHLRENIWRVCCTKCEHGSPTVWKSVKFAAIFFCQPVKISLIANTTEDCRLALVLDFWSAELLKHASLLYLSNGIGY